MKRSGVWVGAADEGRRMTWTANGVLLVSSWDDRMLIAVHTRGQ